MRQLVDSVAVVSLLLAGVAVVIAALTWLESWKLRQPFEKVAKALPLVARPRRKPTGKQPSTPAVVQAAAEERRRLKLDLDREKHEWRKNRDIVNALGWIVERMNEDGYDDE